jgi:hypothetical protein
MKPLRKNSNNTKSNRPATFIAQTFIHRSRWIFHFILVHPAPSDLRADPLALQRRYLTARILWQVAPA